MIHQLWIIANCGVEKFGTCYARVRSEQSRLETDDALTATKASSSVGVALAAFDLAKDTSVLRLG